MGHNDYSMLVQKYGRWAGSELPSELERIWGSMQNMRQMVLNLPQENSEETITS
ncbi:hypothetical protein HNQ49_001710 [Parapusillimonas granuli]|nr:hypothetical protein [Parapusillimonas granuli]